MNSFILMAEVIQEPQLRYTSDNQTPIAEFLVQFDALREEDPPATLKVVGWGNLAQDIQTQYHVGDRLIIEGRLNMNSVDRPEGFKEKRAELTAQRIHKINGVEAVSSVSTTAVNETSQTNTTPVAPTTPTKSRASTSKTAKPNATKPGVAETPASTKATTYSAPMPEPDYDEIPF
jgi:single-stranded DNA-binding protein